MHDAYITPAANRSILARWATWSSAAGPWFTRYSIVFLLLLFGAMKWTSGEANGIQPLISHSPLWSWLYGVFGVQGTSIFFGVFEVGAAIAIGLRPWLPLISGLGSTFTVVMFLTTISFLFTTPGLLAKPDAGFIMKDLVLLGGSIWAAGEALQAWYARSGIR